MYAVFSMACFEGYCYIGYGIVAAEKTFSFKKMKIINIGL